ncbi:hypothetical protein Bphy_5096 [Paraburkholderia phymatum STM815]|uniref:Uncharacterized protein n=1 Tax=Paraburkholderia phymatum (strain DSM 17167 / CIP 108236 / LMG 21445 / STM815) TaxID=391038 RepID=B2JLV5_PARP8|nr:hypothetical protein Bphy_5096 [Paraburkholderia phymatum STM815]
MGHCSLVAKVYNRSSSADLLCAADSRTIRSRRFSRRAAPPDRLGRVEPINRMQNKGTLQRGWLQRAMSRLRISVETMQMTQALMGVRRIAMPGVAVRLHGRSST